MSQESRKTKEREMNGLAENVKIIKGRKRRPRINIGRGEVIKLNCGRGLKQQEMNM